jgi:membrane fusion protein, multidrug efflux system
MSEKGNDIVGASPPRKSPNRRGYLTYLVLAVILVLAAYFGPKAVYSFTHESTDNAQIVGKIVPVSAEVDGKVAKVAVDDNQRVKEGQVLVEIEDKRYGLEANEKEAALERTISEKQEILLSIEEKSRALDRATADLEVARAEEELALKDKLRYRSLIQNNAVPRRVFDQAETRWNVAVSRTKSAVAAVSEGRAAVQNLGKTLSVQENKIKEARAALALAQLRLTKTVVRAPVAGRIAGKNTDAGKYVRAGQALLAIVTEKDVWVVANYKETQIEDIEIGNPVDIEVDAYPGRLFKGHVDSFQQGTGAVFSLLPPENATGNFIKVVQRVPVKIVLDDPPDPDHPLMPGMSVTPHVETGKKRARGNG